MSVTSHIRISVIIIAYNAAKYISQCLNSLVCQELEKEAYEILVVNDGSKDNTLELCQSNAENYPQIIFFDKPKVGLGSTRDFDLSVAKGIYIYVIDFLKNFKK